MLWQILSNDPVILFLGELRMCAWSKDMHSKWSHRVFISSKLNNEVESVYNVNGNGKVKEEAVGYKHPVSTY